MELGKIIVAPDSYKGVMSSKRAADIIGEEIASAVPDCVIVKIPVADGGEGSLETIISSTGGVCYKTPVVSPGDNIIDASFGITDSGTAVLEMAQSSGLARQNGLHPLTSCTYGFGQLIIAALDRGARSFILCVGGSATTDGGCGMAAALGVTFRDKHGRSFIPCGGTLTDIADIGASGLDTRVGESVFTVMCDVDNPLHGTNGAAHVYGPQKGASPVGVALLDDGLKHYGSLLRSRFGVNYAEIPGAGAAGGLGAGCMAFLNAKLVRGSEAILELCGFRERVKDADLVITGEGRLDEQSFSGKVLSGILSILSVPGARGVADTGGSGGAGSTGGAGSARANVPVCSICGTSLCTEALLKQRGVVVFETSAGVTEAESMRDPEKYLRIAARKAITSMM